MRPILFEVFGWGVPSWHLFFVLAAFTAYFVAWFSARRALQLGCEKAQGFLSILSTLFIVCYIAGWFGARALSIVVEQFDVKTFADFVSALFSIGPMTFYGGAIAAVVLGSLYVWRKRISLPMSLDFGVLAGVFALSVGRVGCFLNGDDYGLPVANQSEPAWWAVRFAVLQDGGVYRYPVQIAEALAALLIGLWGWWLVKRCYAASCPQPGKTAAWVALVAATQRFLNEGFRGDPRGFFLGTQISTSSGISLLIVIFCAYCLVRLRISSK